MGTYRAVCPECETIIKKDTEQAAFDVVTNHNERRHDGNRVAGVPQEDVQSTGDAVIPDHDTLDDGAYLRFLAALGEADPLGVRD